VLGGQLEIIERGMEAMASSEERPDGKLKNTINFLIRENLELKKERALLKRQLETRGKEIDRLKSKIAKLTSEDEGGYSDPVGEEEQPLT